jgi:hypothetical protein
MSDGIRAFIENEARLRRIDDSFIDTLLKASLVFMAALAQAADFGPSD